MPLITKQTLIPMIASFLLGTAIGASFIGGSNKDSQSSESVTNTASETRSSHTVSMSNSAKSEPIELSGAYKVNWETYAGDCTKEEVDLRAAWDTDYSYYGIVFNVDGYGSGTSYFYELDQGYYYLEADDVWSTTCNWKATFTPINLP